MIYFDHNATTPVDDRVLEAMLPFLMTFYGNPSGLYRLARISRSAIDTAREQIAQLVNAQAEQVIFTSGGTEANNLALKGIKSAPKILTSVIEHPSVLEVGSQYLIGVTPQGYIDVHEAAKFTEHNIDIASFMLVNNETGVIQDIARLSKLFRAYETLVHVDAVQAGGKIALDFSALGIDLMSLSSHKIYGPKGCGALIVANNNIQMPLFTGGGQESGYRSGTENVAAIVGFGKAAELAYIELEQRQQHCLKLRQYLEAQLEMFPRIKIIAQHSKRVANTIQFTVANCVGEMLLMQLDKQGIAVSSGSACASEQVMASHVLIAMGIPENLAKSALRISFGQQNTVQEIDIFIQKLKEII